MAGYREFQTGEVLTAGNVNSFLMEQATMTFADAAARDAALAGVLREGLLTYNLDTGALERYDGTAWVPAAPVIPGIGSNVVQTVKTDTFTSSSSTFVTVTGLTATITPSTDTSKILVMTGFTLNGQPGQSTGIARLMRASTPIFIGDAAGTRIQGFVGVEHGGFQTQTVSAMFVDAPTTDAPVTYSVEVRRGGLSGSVTVNGSQDNTDSANRTRTAASLILIEVAP